ncbi:hypothetical protein [Pseudomonas soli]|uniref:hypothetical protein n=1 Tax=Pseudomonas soli TaxID=1306993 RepID=UPI003CFE18AC
MANLYRLIEWLSVKSRVFSWDVVAALHAGKVNHLLEQAYIEKFNNNSYLPEFSEPVVVNGLLTYYMHNFLLDWPRMSFAERSLDDSLARLNMVVISGRLVTISAIPNAWQVYSLEAITPLHGPVLTLDVLLSQAGGLIEEDGRLLLDLSNSDNFSIDIDDDEEVRIITGDLFKALFKKLKPEERVYVLGKLNNDAPEHMRPYSFALRTQLDDEHGDEQAGAVVIFVSLKPDHKGEPPHSGADFQYLLPGDYPDYDAAVLLSTRRIMLLALVPLLQERFGSTPRICYNDELLGWLAVPDAYIEMAPIVDFIDQGVLSWDIWVSINTPPGQLKDAAHAPSLQRADDCKDQDFVIALTEKGADLTWNIDVSIQIDMIGFLSAADIERLPSLTLRYQYTTHYKVVDEVPARVVREEGVFEAPDAAQFDQELMDFFEGMYKFRNDPNPSGNALAVLSFCTAHMREFAEMVVAELDKEMLIDAPVNEWVDQLIELNFGETMVASITRGPCDVARFGEVAVAADAPKVSPLWPIIGSGEQQQFEAQSESGVTWDVEPVKPGPALGTIDKRSGLYTAPSSDKFSDSLWRERIKATTATGSVSYSLATVTRDNLLISPLVRFCKPDEEITLVASASTANPDTLRWTAQAGQFASATGKTVKYTAPSNDKKQAYLIDQVVVSDPVSGATFTAYLITRMTNPKVIQVKVDESAGSAELSVPGHELYPADEVEWTVKGPGTVVAVDGEVKATYRPDPASEAPFALVELEIREYDAKRPASEPIRIRGVVILPLPLHRYALPDEAAQP